MTHYSLSTYRSILPPCFHPSKRYQNSVYPMTLKFYLFFIVGTLNGIRNQSRGFSSIDQGCLAIVEGKVDLFPLDLHDDKTMVV